MNRYGYRRYSDSTLMSLTKREIIELLRVAEHNYFVTDEALDNSAKAGRELAEKLDKHGRWIFADDGYCRCSECNQKAPSIEDEVTMTDHCPHCGAKMDGDTSNET